MSKNTNTTLILHDTFLYKGGGERLILMMGKILGADIASGFFSMGSFDLRKEGFKGKLISVSSEVYKKGLRHILLKYSFLYKTKFIRDYQTVIFSGDSISAVRNCNINTKKVYYCHTPPRYIYDLHHIYRKKTSWYLLPFFLLGCKIFKFLYERDIAKMDIILTNSINTQERIKNYLGYDSVVIYPPVDRTKFVPLGDGGYFLSFARLADAKRVDYIVEAFQGLPEEKLIVIYGKNDPQKEKIIKQAQAFSNISCITLNDNDQLYTYIGNARASIYIPIEEDFGMSPVESMAAGKPVLGVREGGLKESIIHKKTGYLLEPNFTISDLQNAVKYLSVSRCHSMKQDCIDRSADFSLEVFGKKISEVINIKIHK